LFVSFGLPVLGIVILAGAYYDGIKNANNNLGKARWAKVGDIRKAGLFSEDGLILGKFQNRYLISDKPTHAMVMAPTRSGKGVGLVVPNLLAWKDSLICLDIKRENYAKTAGFRKDHGHEVFFWSPMNPDGRSHRYNPLDAVSNDPYKRISDIQIIAKILIQDPARSDPIWASEARALFVGLALYVMDNKDMPSTIGAINRLLGTEADLGDVCRHIVKTHPELSTAVKKSLMNFANKAAKERSGVKSSINQAINLWDNPMIDAATSESDFSITDLRRKKMAIYVGIGIEEIDALAPLVRIFCEQVIKTLSRNEPGEDEPYKVLMLMDEIHMLGRMESMTSAFTLLAGFNVRIMAIVQDISWLDETYGRNVREGVLSCCAHQIYFANNNTSTNKYVSDACGETTVETISISRRKTMRYEAPTKNISHRTRPLITKEEIHHLPETEQIILVEASPPIHCNKIRYYEDKNFKDRHIPAPEVPLLIIKHEAIPEFSIPSEEYTKAPAIDPNQTDMFSGNLENDDFSDAIQDSDIDAVA
jgi:type IV secretion system protein VirD4